MNLSGSVGNKGRNSISDVRQVQKLLNENNARPKLNVDGVCGKKTINAINWFQERIVRLRSPDGRVDPGGKTWRSLRKHNGKNQVTAAPKPNSPSTTEKKEFSKERRKFVDPRVKENKSTTQIINAIFPHFKDSGVKVISGYLSDSDLFWKVNYHWEYLIWMIDHSLSQSIEKNYKQKLESSKTALLSNQPNPKQGYRTSASVGKPVDSSSTKTMTERHKTISQHKRTFKDITRKAKLIDHSNRSSTSFHLAAAPVAHPGTSKHSTGYALDIKGSAGTIRSISKRLGATLVFDEKSHVHVEFKNGMPG